MLQLICSTSASHHHIEETHGELPNRDLDRFLIYRERENLRNYFHYRVFQDQRDFIHHQLLYVLGPRLFGNDGGFFMFQKSISLEVEQ